jgi:hypothetical protein
MISTYLYFYKHVLSDMGINFLEKNPKTLKIYIFVKLFKKMKQKIFFFKDDIIQKKSDQIMVKEAYLQIKLSLKSTFDILLFHKINL